MASTPPTARLTLLTMPGEILNNIFCNVARSSTGFATFEFRDLKQTMRIIEHWEPQAGFGRLEYELYKNMEHVTPISLAFLRTCKKIHDDFRDLVFVTNTFVMDMLNIDLVGAPSGVGRQAHLRHSFTHRLQKIHIDYYLFLLKSDSYSIKVLKQWVLNGNLRSVTLATRDTRMFHTYTIDVITRTFKLLGGTFRGMTLKMVLTMDMAVKVKALTLEPSGGSERVHFDDLIRDFHWILGGEFWIGDTLCWKDGNQVNQIPKIR